MPRNSSIPKNKSVKVSQTSTNKPEIIEHKIQQPSFISNVVQGFAWGTGTSIARSLFEPKIISKPEERNTCDQYKLCLKMDYPEECFNKMDQKEYERCNIK
jgi:hypothetical protein